MWTSLIRYWNVRAEAKACARWYWWRQPVHSKGQAHHIAERVRWPGLYGCTAHAERVYLLKAAMRDGYEPIRDVGL